MSKHGDMVRRHIFTFRLIIYKTKWGKTMKLNKAKNKKSAAQSWSA